MRHVTDETPGNPDVRVGEYLRDSVESEDKLEDKERDNLEQPKHQKTNKMTVVIPETAQQLLSDAKLAQVEEDKNKVEEYDVQS